MLDVGLYRAFCNKEFIANKRNIPALTEQACYFGFATRESMFLREGLQRIYGGRNYFILGTCYWRHFVNAVFLMRFVGKDFPARSCP